MVFDEVTTADRLIGIATPVVAGAELGGRNGTGPIDFVIPQGERSALSEMGVYVRLVDLHHPLELTRAYPLTPVFEKGGKVEADLSIDCA